MSYIIKPKISDRFYKTLLDFERQIKKYVDVTVGVTSLGYVILDESYPGWAVKEIKANEFGTMVTVVEEHTDLCANALFDSQPELKYFMDEFKLEFLLGAGPFFAWPAHRHNIIMQRYAISVPDLSYHIPVKLYTKKDDSDTEYTLDVENDSDVIFLEEFEFFEEDKVIVFPGGKNIYHGTDPTQSTYENFARSYNRLFHIKDMTSREEIKQYCNWLETL